MSDITSEDFPFHRGEQEIQARVGMRDKMRLFGGQAIRDHMPDQHREFYASLPYLFLGTVDEAGRPWASVATGRPGFVSTPDGRTLSVAAPVLTGDPLAHGLSVGAPVGVLGLEFSSRRRNRVNGRVTAHGGQGFTIAVDQAFGNCPQYIQTRAPKAADDAPPSAPQAVTRRVLVDADRASIAAADTFFIATHFSENRGRPVEGADVSHRGGKPGFVRMDDEATLTWPDFAGNSHFNTLGNLLLNPKAGLLFVDFTSGGLLYMTGVAETIWDGADLASFEGAERLVRFRLDTLIRLDGALPFRWDFEEYSPVLERTGVW